MAAKLCDRGQSILRVSRSRRGGHSRTRKTRRLPRESHFRGATAHRSHYGRVILVRALYTAIRTARGINLLMSSLLTQGEANLQRPSRLASPNLLTRHFCLLRWPTPASLRQDSVPA